jgi:hypothetical protein
VNREYEYTPFNALFTIKYYLARKGIAERMFNMKKTRVDEQRRSREIRKIGKAILRAYAHMAVGKSKPYFSEINKIVQQLDDLCLCPCEVFENLGLYGFVCSAYEHYNTGERMDDWSMIRPDKSLRHLRTAILDLEDLGWPAPGHVQFWDWIGELRRRRSEYLKPKRLPSDRQLNPWEWVIEDSDWEKFNPSFDQGELSDDTGVERFVIGYYGDEEEPVSIYRKDEVWIASNFGNAGWREVTIISTGWRSPASADWDLKRSPRLHYIGMGWYDGPGTEPEPAHEDEDDDE